MPNFPTFPRVGEPWDECDICGFDFPKSKVRRDRYGRLVCAKCLDDPGRDDYLENFEVPSEEGYGEPHEPTE